MASAGSLWSLRHAAVAVQSLAPDLRLPVNVYPLFPSCADQHLGTRAKGWRRIRTRHRNEHRNAGDTLIVSLAKPQFLRLNPEGALYVAIPVHYNREANVDDVSLLN